MPKSITRDKVKLDTLVTFYDCWRQPRCLTCYRRWLCMTVDDRKDDFRKRRGKKPLRQHLKEWVPPLYDMLAELKHNDHAHAALLMQNLEATMFIHRICGRLAREEPNMPLFTLHDSLLVPSTCLPALRAIIVEEFARIGLPLAPTALKEKHHA
jgi:hypothetical protein